MPPPATVKDFIFNSDYLDDNVMQKHFSGKEKYIYFFYSFLERKNPRFYDTILIESIDHQNVIDCHGLISLRKQLYYNR
jgi:heme oxygenase